MPTLTSPDATRLVFTVGDLTASGRLDIMIATLALGECDPAKGDLRCWQADADRDVTH